MAARLKLKVDLVDVIKSITSDERKLAVYLPLVADQSFKREYGLRLIDDIEQRLDRGRDKDNQPMKKYSDAYKKSEQFRFWGKDNTVNLKLTGAMRASIDVATIGARTVELAFADQLENDKAHGHVYGANKLPIRDFWGVPDKSKKQIMKDMIREFSGRETVEIEVGGVNAEIGAQSIDLTGELEDG